MATNGCKEKKKPLKACFSDKLKAKGGQRQLKYLTVVSLLNNSFCQEFF